MSATPRPFIPLYRQVYPPGALVGGLAFPTPVTATEAFELIVYRGEEQRAMLTTFGEAKAALQAIQPWLTQVADVHPSARAAKAQVEAILAKMEGTHDPA
mgnify:FL=1